MFAIMDNETRFWLAQQVADSKFKHDAKSLLEMGRDVAGITQTERRLSLTVYQHIMMRSKRYTLAKNEREKQNPYTFFEIYISKIKTETTTYRKD